MDVGAPEAHALWLNSIVAPWYLREDQHPIYEILCASDRPFVECARRYGKTTTILIWVIEQLLSHPGWVCLWCEPDKNQAREIVQPEIVRLFNTAPDSLRPVWSSTDSFYWFPSTGDRDTASRIKLRGVNHDRGDSARGPYAHIIVADEYGFWKDPGYTIREALAPQLQTTRGPLIKASTPPEDLGHPYYDEKGDAIMQGRFVQRILWDNETITPSDLEKIYQDTGGKDSPAFLREYLCKPVSNPEKLVIPEYREDVHDVPDDYPRPEHVTRYVGFDLGLNDNTAFLFGYYDFLARELVIEDEYVANGKNSKEIAESCQTLELALWGTKASCRCDNLPVTKVCHTHGPQPLTRIGDNEKQQLFDMSTQFGYDLYATQKDDKAAAIAALRVRFASAKIKIKKRCKNIRYQLKVGLWNDRRTDFQRGEKTGHLDAVDALIYLHRNLSENHNPFPQRVLDIEKYFTPASGLQGGDQELARLFSPNAGGLG